MLLNTRIIVDLDPLNKLLEQEEGLRGKHTMLLMSPDTFYALTCTHFSSDNSNQYRGFRVIKDESLPLGEVIILSDYEKAKKDFGGIDYEQNYFINLCDSNLTKSTTADTTGYTKAFNNEK